MLQLAFEVGYNDPNYFSRVFKKVCKKSPSQYKDSLFGIGLHVKKMMLLMEVSSERNFPFFC
ncbi:AraC family transcriptional regulator [Bacillus sp. F19]|nr:AraC family transcriptional regulator [Bacillus sp. F19]